jgi:outer membrane protein TolC
MRCIKPLGVLCFAAGLACFLPAGYAQQQNGQSNPPPPTPQLDSERLHWYSGFTHPYTAPVVPPISLYNSMRVDSLLRAGKLYLSLSDTIALALENNLDIELERYEFPLAQADLLRARSGSSIIGIPTNVLPAINTTSGIVLLGSNSAGLAAQGAATSLAPGLSYDPALIGTVSWGHLTTPQSNTVLSGTTELVSTNKISNVSLAEAFPTGGSISLGFNNLNQEQNSFRQTINPATTSSLDLTVTQPLLQGFGLALNNRTIRIAKNNLRAADLVFRQQLINAVGNVVQLYWTLVAANLNVEVKQQAVAVSQKLYEDNKKQVEVGTLAPIEIARAEAQLASDQQALLTAQSTVLQLETVLKSALSRDGLASPVVSEARIVATDPIRIPEVEPVEPIQDVVARALENRPDLSQSRMQIENSKIALQGIKNTLLPTLNAFADLRNNALIGTQNNVFGTNATTGLVSAPPIADPFFLGGFGGILGQLFSRNFPNYSVGLNLNIPLRNRAAQANIATATLMLRENELQVQRQINQVRVDIQSALIALQEARAQYQTAVKQRVLEEQTVDADQKKLDLGATTVFQLIQDQRDLSTAGANVVSAEATYAQARAQLDIATGMTLQNNNVEFEDAKSGHVTRPPSPLPALDQNPPSGAGGHGARNLPNGSR